VACSVLQFSFITSTIIPKLYLEVGHYCFLPNTFQIIILLQPFHLNLSSSLNVVVEWLSFLPRIRISWVQISVRGPAILTEVFRDLSHSRRQMLGFLSPWLCSPVLGLGLPHNCLSFTPFQRQSVPVLDVDCLQFSFHFLSPYLLGSSHCSLTQKQVKC
jgi:hypothetical protein